MTASNNFKADSSVPSCRRRTKLGQRGKTLAGASFKSVGFSLREHVGNSTARIAEHSEDEVLRRHFEGQWNKRLNGKSWSPRVSRQYYGEARATVNESKGGKNYDISITINDHQEILKTTLLAYTQKIHEEYKTLMQTQWGRCRSKIRHLEERLNEAECALKMESIEKERLMQKVAALEAEAVAPDTV